MADGDKNYSGSIALSKLIHVRMKKKGKGKKKIDCLVIPIEQNFLIEGKDGAVYMNVNVKTREEEDDYGQHGFIGQTMDSKKWKSLSKKEQKAANEQLQILGNIKNFAAGGGGNDASGAAGDEIDEDDDLPF